MYHTKVGMSLLSCKDNANEWKSKIKRVLILFSRVQLIFTAGRVMQTSGKAK